MAQFLLSAPPERRAKLLDSGDWHGFCVITEDVPECLDLARWLEAAVASAVAASSPAPPPTVVGTGEFTHAFGRIVATVPHAAVGAPAASEATRIGPENLAHPKQDPGAFTRFFDMRAVRSAQGTTSQAAGPLPSAPAATPGTSTPQAPVHPVEKQPAGEFTRMFHGGASPHTPPRETSGFAQNEFLGSFRESTPTTPARSNRPPDTAGAADSPPGEFTRMFSGSTVTGTPAAPEPQAERARGEFTRMFSGSPPPVTPEPLHPASALPPGEFTGMFSAGTGETRTAATTQPAAVGGPSGGSEFDAWFGSPIAQGSTTPPAVPEPVPQSQQHGGEFTRLFGKAQPMRGDLPIEAPAPVLSSPPVVERPPVAAPPLAEPPAAPVQPSLSGPSEFTRIIGSSAVSVAAAPAAGVAPAAGSAQTATPQAAPAAKPAASPSNTVLIFFIAAVICAAVLFVLYFALKK
ncbi:MAG TPA: hypothetical protein VFL57_11555 [Bryobacteraceae bacterium]|nr:hypothetical protein [Bryobacteraceae bacterium]